MSGFQIGPGGGQVGPGGGEIGPQDDLSSNPPSGIITLTGGVPTTIAASTFPPSGVITLSGGVPSSAPGLITGLLIGPGGGQVGPGGGMIGPDTTGLVPSGIITITGGVPAPPLIESIPSGVVTLGGPNPTEAPTDDSWVRGTGNPIIEPTETWEGTVVRGLRVIATATEYQGWYSGGDPEAIGYVSCAIADDPTDPANWTKEPTNPILTGAALPWVGIIGDEYWLTYRDAAGDLYLTRSADGITGWTTPILMLDRSTPIGGGTSVTVSGTAIIDTGATSQDWHGRVSIVPLLDGTWLILYRDGSAHNVNDGALHCRYRAADGHYSDKDKHLDGTPVSGFPMNPPGLIAGEDAGEPLGVRLPNGDIGVLMWKSDYGVTANGTYMSRSTDDGQSFGIPAGPLSFPGFSSTHDTDLRTFATDQGFIHVESGYFYMAARIYTTHTDQSKATMILVRSADNGLTWERTGTIVNLADTPGSRGAQETSLTRIGANGILCMIRDNPQTKSYRRFGTITWATGAVVWGALEDVTATVGIAGRQRVYTMAQLRGEANWWLDPNLIMFGFETLAPGNSQARANRVWLCPDGGGTEGDGGITWAKYADDTNSYGGDGGYGDGLYDPTTGHVHHLSYRGALTAAQVVDYDLVIDDGFIHAWAGRDMWREDGAWRMLVAGEDGIGRSRIYYATSPDGATWTLARSAQHYDTLHVVPDGMTGGPVVRRVSSTTHVWYHAAAVAGNLPPDIYHASTTDVTADAWTTPDLVFAHSGTGFEVDSVADPDILIGTGAAVGIAFLFFSGADNGAGTGAVGVALASAVGGITLAADEHVTSDLDLIFDIGAITSEITLPFDIRGPDITSDITLPFDILGAGFSDITLPFDILGPVTSDIDLVFDILDTAIVGGGRLRGVPPLWQPLMVFDKAGGYLGSINPFNVSNPPVRYLRSSKITNEGGMTFNVPRQSGDMALIADDRLVRLQSPRGEKPWWGTMSVQPDARGIHEVTTKDPLTLLRDGRGITLKEDVNDNTPATAVMAKLMAIHNDLRARDGEVQWELDLQGSRPFRGDIDFDGDTLSCIDIILKRSRTEIAWDSRLEGNRLVPILRMRDRFDAGAGADIFDGPNGNVTAGVQVVEDPTTLVFRLRLRGLTTDLAACLPEWARWALQDITPEVTVEVDPGPYRMREIRDESVDWGLSKAAIAAQCNAILDWLWALYRSYLRALHDIEGRPNHEGWAYVGPPDIYEPQSAGKDSLSRRAWRTRLQLVEVRDNEPASAVMISESHSQINLREWLIVRYNRVTGVQNVTVWAIETAAGVELIKWNLTGSATLYHVSGERIIGRSTITTTGAFVDPYNTRIYDPVAKRYRELRRIINGPFALAYYVDPADADNAFVDLGVDAAISTTSGDGSSLIGKMYDFERFAIETWDPRRDGIGARLARPTVFFGSPTTRPRWHVVSFDVGGDASTQLTHGIGASAPGTANDIEVDSIFGFPDPDLEPDAFPFLVSIDDGMDQEDVLVLSMTGTLWHVLRGQNGTDAIIHEAGAPVKRFGADAWPGFPFPYTWPEGEQWAAEELADLSKPRIDVNVHVAHFRDDQLTIDYGSTHAVNVSTEGAAGRWVGTGRVIGWSTDPGHNPSDDDPTPPGGETEVVLEWQQ